MKELDSLGLGNNTVSLGCVATDQYSLSFSNRLSSLPVIMEPIMKGEANIKLR